MMRALLWLIRLFLIANFSSLALAGMVYTDNLDGTVTDASTGLTWMRCSVGQTWDGSTCIGKATLYSWGKANALTGSVIFAGQNDWRLPNIRELNTMVDSSAARLAADIFPNTPSVTYWSSSPHAYSSTDAWVVYFTKDTNYGNVFFEYVGSAGAARMVRGRQTPGVYDNARPSTDYVDHGDGTVTHTPTGLEWQRCVVGQILVGNSCTGTAEVFTWDAAKLLTSDLAGRTDWRLPNVQELLSLVNYTDTSPAINETIFPNTPSTHFWSSSPNATYANYAWLVDFMLGTHGNGGSARRPFAVRLVRGEGSATLPPTTAPPPATALVLNAGWNLLGNSLDQTLPVATLFADPTLVKTVWKWDAAKAGWQFYAPSLDASALQAYADSKGYGVLSVINPGEGYWVNAGQTTKMANQSGSVFTMSASYLQTGWNLVATGHAVSPAEFNASLSGTPAAQGTIPLNLTSLWAWDNLLSQWYFYSPALAANGKLGTYALDKGYLDFAASGMVLGVGMGFWVNKP